MNVRIIHSETSTAIAASLAALLRSHWPAASVDVSPVTEPHGHPYPRTLVVIVDGASPQDISAEVASIRQTSDSPLVVYAPHVAEKYEIEWLHRGADEVIDAVSSARFLAIIDALVRRTLHENELVERIRSFGDLTLHLSRQVLMVHDQWVPMTPTEFRLLEAISAVPGCYATTADLTQEVWGTDNKAVRDSLKVHISHVRRKLALADSEFTVKVSRGHGYTLTQREGMPNVGSGQQHPGNPGWNEERPQCPTSENRQTHR